MRSTRRYLAIDGLRGIAAVGVAWYHIHPVGSFWMFTFVDLFFVISGFLITGILLRLQDWDWPNLRNFWMRRILRIWPVYYLTLAFVLLLWLAWSLKHGQPPRPFAGFWESTVFLHYLVGDYAALPPGVNYLWWFGHSWSLAVEEQFYLAWPILLWQLRRHPAACIASLLALQGAVLYFQATSPLPDYLVITRGTGLVLGSILAVLHHSPAYRQRLQAKPLSIRMAAVALLLAGALLVLPYLMEGYAAMPHHGRSTDPFLTSKFTLVYAALIWMAASDLFPALNRVLRTGVLVYLGTLSYAIYMFHVPLQKLLDQAYNANLIGSRLLVQLIFWPLLIGAAELSRRYYEARFERMKAHFPLPPAARHRLDTVSAENRV